MHARTMTFAYIGAIAVAAVAILVVAKRTGTAVASAANAVNPFNQDNLFARASNAVVQSISGQPDTTLGSWLYDLTVKAGVNPDAGAIATAPSFPAPSINLDDYAATVEADDQAAGGWISNAGGAATGRTRMKK